MGRVPGGRPAASDEPRPGPARSRGSTCPATRGGGFKSAPQAPGYSARDGTSHPEDPAVSAAERGMSALAQTDRDAIAGTVRFAKARAAHGVRPILGVDAAVAPTSPDTPRARRRRTPARGGAHVVEAPPRVTLLARVGGASATVARPLSRARWHPVRSPAPTWARWAVVAEFERRDIAAVRRRGMLAEHHPPLDHVPLPRRP
ncbi:PHP domain-containing protein [Embleya sp. NBC_00888]|uniref:PHP domain-containing protein n=1 Tax=Embleya sp. NBC_00888 TaxID=2975960 RepID=UPI00386D0169